MANKNLLRVAFGTVMVLLLVLLPLFGCAPKAAPPGVPPAEKKVYEYYLPFSTDHSGPYADICPRAEAGHSVFIDYWNETKGKELGVKLITKFYETRYDPKVVASIYPGVVAELKPLAWLGLGGPDVAALRERLSDDKVVLVMTTGTYGFDWKPMNWIIQPRPTYPHEGLACIDWYLKNVWKENRKLRVASVNFEGSPAYLDGEKGFANACKTTFADRIEYIGCAWVDFIPADVTDRVRPLIKDVDLFWVFTNVTIAVAARKACITLGRPDIPIVLSTHNCILDVNKVLPFEQMENFYDSGCFGSYLNHDTPAYKDVWAKRCPPGFDVVKDWTMTTIQFGGARALFLPRVLERAIAEVGPDKLTGEALYNTFKKVALTEKEMMGMTGALSWTPDQPFPKVETLRVSLTTVKGGKHVIASPSWPVPDIPKWVK